MVSGTRSSSGIDKVLFVFFMYHDLNYLPWHFVSHRPHILEENCSAAQHLVSTAKPLHRVNSFCSVITLHFTGWSVCECIGLSFPIKIFTHHVFEFPRSPARNPKNVMLDIKSIFFCRQVAWQHCPTCVMSETTTVAAQAVLCPLWRSDGEKRWPMLP